MNKFDPANTQQEVFHGLQGDKTVPMMHLEGKFMVAYNSGNKNLPWSMKIWVQRVGKGLTNESRFEESEIKFKLHLKFNSSIYFRF